MSRIVRSYADAAPDQITAAVVELRRRFPGATVWFGQSTFRWWALVRSGGWRLIEAVSPTELARALDDADGWPWLPRSGRD